MRFQKLEKGTLTPLETFLFEKYIHKLDTLSGIDDFPPSMRALADKYPDVAAMFCGFCRRVQDVDMTEDRYLIDDLNVSVFTSLRYLPKPQHSHQFFEILFVTEGTCENVVEQTSLTLRKGDLCFIAPDVPHTIINNSHDTIVYNIIVRTSTFQNTFTNIYGRNDIISEFFTRSLYRRSKSISPYILCKTDCEEALTSLVDRMVDEEHSKRKFADRTVNLLFEFFILELLRRHEMHFTVGETTDNIEHESITAILRYMQGNYKTLTLPETAKFFHCSESHFSRMIKRFTGKNFVEIVQTIKIQKAERLLTEENMSVSEIVEEIGYTDNSHFYKVFRQHYGLTPLQYKKSKCEERAAARE